MKKKLVIGILAHVDAGKTTLSEALLYHSGAIRTLGRVDHKNTYLDTNPVERERGITVFSKQARFASENCDFILLDTPGHVDFSAETERTLALLDYAILVVSAPDGVQNHTRTLWQLLEFYGVPTYIFVNKTDISIRLAEEMEAEIAKKLSPRAVAFHEKDTREEREERLAMVDEQLLELHLAGEPIENEDIAPLIAERRLFPILFGSALRMLGVSHLLEVIDRTSLLPVYEHTDFAARVYKIARAGNVRLTYMKLTGGVLSPRDEITYLTSDGKKLTEKVSQLRLYSGDRFEQADRVSAGEICAVVGLSATYVGQGLGKERRGEKPVLEPVLSYRIMLPDDADPMLYFPKFKELEEEEPSLHLAWNEELHEIQARLMGDIQIDLVCRLIAERFDISVTFGTGKILYKEKIKEKAIGIGHFEPLRHYAEVQLLMEPAPKGAGLYFDTMLPENSLDTNWQRLILSHLYEKTHRGVLTGAILTDTKITLVAGKAHLKHTEGGDFREATLRAVRHGLMRGGCTLLEPFYKFRLEVPSALVGRAMSDLELRFASFELEASDGELATLIGRGPVSTLHDYTKELISYTKGQGRFSCTSDGYEPCHNEEEIIAATGYDPEGDLDNSPHSVFCAHGAGFLVPWNEVENYKHLDAEAVLTEGAEALIPKVSVLSQKYAASDEELEAIMMREFGPIRRKQYSEPKVYDYGKAEKKPKKTPMKPQKHLTIIDGYNLIFAWDELKKKAAVNLEEARDNLMDLLASYVAYTKTQITLVFDAYLVKDGKGSAFRLHDFDVVFTKENETADMYIEKLMAKLGPDYSIRVVTGDRLVQNSALVSGVLRMTTSEFHDEVSRVGREITEFVRDLALRK